uniref:acyl-CoA carboxylase subunit beta n=1 Tax=Eubacterium cellulosolvens TaxID=29322 RepID=UPI0004889B4C|nr:carboxyl transferase domain-containing protein [[Eubacterium] cellulosolvens]
MSNNTQSPARMRISTLLDANSFVEVGAGVTARSTDFNMAEKKAPSDGVITGYGLINGNPVYVYSQDASVLNGTIGEMHARKIVKIYELAIKTGAPVVGLVDCAGLRLEEATDALNAFGEIYMAQADASGVVPQITGIFGNCGGGMAFVPAMSDFTFMENDAKLFVNSPNAIAGNTEAKCDTASAEFQGTEAGTIDGMGTEAEVITKIRNLVEILPANNEDDMSYADTTDDLNRTSADLINCIEDPALLLPRISDDSVYVEAKPYYGKDTVTAFIKLNGYTVGVVANRSVLYGAGGAKEEEFGKVMSARGAKKAAEFVNFCDAFSIPLVTFTNVTGFKACKCSEMNMANAVGKLNYAFANATTPKVNVVTGEAFGSAYLAMNSKSLGADIVYAWKDAKIGMMDALAAAKIICDGQSGDAIKEQAEKYAALQNSVESAAARGYVDTVIDASETRKYLIGALDMLFTKREFRPDKKHGTV